MPAPATAVATAEKPKDRALVVQTALESRAAALMDVMPEGMDGKRFMRATLTAISRNPKLLECTPESLITAVFDAAEVGLVPTGALNRAWLVPQRHNTAGRGRPPVYVTKAELRIGYQGLADLARNSGAVKSIESRPVYDGEAFEVFYGTDPFITHAPNFAIAGHVDKLTAVYAVAVLADDTRIFEVMTRGQIDAIRARAPGANNGPWATDFIQMARKTVLRRLCNYLPLAPETQAALAKVDSLENAPAAVSPGTRSNEVKALLERRASPSDLPQGEEIEGEADEVTPVGAAETQETAADDDDLADDAVFQAVLDANLGPKR